MKDWRRSNRAARRLLRTGDTIGALRELNAAISLCPVGERRSLASMLYLLGMILVKLDRPEVALQSWSASRKLDKGGYAAREFGRFANGYGMLRQPTADRDDFYAFRSIQVSRYLAAAESRRFRSPGEREMVFVLIADAFIRLRAAPGFTTLDFGQKLSAFRRAEVRFPLMVGGGGGLRPDGSARRSGAIVPFDFAMNRFVLDDSRCMCGSGLPFRLCCGRITSCDDL